MKQNQTEAGATIPPINKLAVNVKEACQLLSVSRACLYRLIERGLIFPSRATRRPLFSIRELERFLRDTSKALTIPKGGSRE